MAPDETQPRYQKDQTEAVVHVVGPLMMQNRFLVDYITREVGFQAIAWEQIEPYLKHSHKDGNRPRLMMLDVHGLQVEQIKTTLRRCADHAAVEYSALFNLPAGRGLEKKVVSYGIRGVFYERDPLPQFGKGVNAILNNELWMSRRVMSDIILEKEDPKLGKVKHASGLTSREVEILEMITIGATNEVIADKLCISKNTVKTHIYNIFKKIGVPNRLQAALWSVKNR